MHQVEVKKGNYTIMVQAPNKAGNTERKTIPVQVK